MEEEEAERDFDTRAAPAIEVDSKKKTTKVEPGQAMKRPKLIIESFPGEEDDADEAA